MEILDIYDYRPKKIPSPQWWECIRKVWEVDPLSCPKWDSEMKIINFIKETEHPSSIRRGVQEGVDLKSTIVNNGLALLIFNILLYHFIGNIAGADSKITASPKVSAPKMFSEVSKF